MPRHQVHLIVDGYNIINAWPILIKHMEVSLESARACLLDYLAEYQKVSGEKVTLIFDAHQLKGAVRKKSKEKGIDVIFTKENETADQYIERKLDILGRKHRIVVASSDAMIQRIILGRGGTRLSANELWALVGGSKDFTRRISKKYKKESQKNLVSLDDKNLEKLELLEKMLEEQ